jgi:hypothetical protein
MLDVRSEQLEGNADVEIDVVGIPYAPHSAFVEEPLEPILMGDDVAPREMPPIVTFRSSD